MATEEDLEVLFGQGLAEESGDLVPLPAMPLLSPAPGPDDPSVAQAVEQGRMQQVDTGEMDDPSPALDEIGIGDEVEIPGGRVEKVTWIDPKRKRIAVGHGRHRTYVSVTDVEEINGRRVGDVVEKQRRDQAREEGMESPNPVAKMPTTISIPDGMTLYPHQIENIEFVTEREGRGLIADEMGLGKTIVALVSLQAPAVIVCPSLLKVNWAREINKWLPELSVTVVNGRKEKPDESQRRADVVVINYDILHAHADWLMARPNRTVVADEAHYLKSLKVRWDKSRREHRAEKGSRRRAVAFYALQKRAPRLLLLTGTPILNRVRELFPLLHMLNPREWGSEYKFCMRYCAGHYEFLGRQRNFKCNGRSNMDELHERIKGVYMMRHTKEAELKNLPSKTRGSIAVSLSKTYATRYRKARNDFLAWLVEQEGEEAVGRALQAEALVKLNKLRAICASGKAEAAVHHIVDHFESTGRPLVVMGVHRDAFDLVGKALDAVNKKVADAERAGKAPPISRQIRWGTVVGGQSQSQRQDAIDAFQDEGTLDVLLYSIPIATGTTLTRASDVLFIERMWRPADQLQAEDRVHRIGQEQKVHITYLDAEGTIDMKLAHLLMDKSETAAAVIDGVDLSEEESAALVLGEMVSFGGLGAAGGDPMDSLRELVSNPRGEIMSWEADQMYMDIGPQGPVPMVFDESGDWIDESDEDDSLVPNVGDDLYDDLVAEGFVLDSWGDPQ